MLHVFQVMLCMQAGTRICRDMQILELRLVLDNHALQQRVIGVTDHKTAEAYQEEQDEEESLSLFFTLPIDHQLGGGCLRA